MQFLTSLLAFATLLLPLVSAETCVAGGPADSVDHAQYCCLKYAGTWYQTYAVQAICVFPDAFTNAYKGCVAGTYQLDTTCIPGTVSLSGSATATPTTDRVTFTGGSSPTVTARSFES